MKHGIARAGLVTGLALFICNGRGSADPRARIREAIARGDVKGASKNLAAEANRLRITGQPPTLATAVDMQNLYLQIGEASGVSLVRMMLESEADEEYIKARGAASRAGFEKVLTLDPRHRPARRALATIAADEGKWPEARLSFEVLVEEDGKDAETRHRFAFALCRQDDLDGALDQWAAALSENPAHADSWYGCGVLWLNRGLFDSAEKALRTALRIDPIHWGVREALIQALVGQEKFEEATSMRVKLRELAPKLPRIGDRIVVAVLPRRGGATRIREALLDSVPWLFRIERFENGQPSPSLELRRDGEAFVWGEAPDKGEFRPVKPVPALPDLQEVLREAQ
ncbi:MAG: tetratricopeptide repeat protein [Planctomycetota bacterium]